MTLAICGLPTKNTSVAQNPTARKMLGAFEHAMKSKRKADGCFQIQRADSSLSSLARKLPIAGSNQTCGIEVSARGFQQRKVPSAVTLVRDVRHGDLAKYWPH